MSDSKDILIKELLDAIQSVVMRLEWLNDPRTGNSESMYIKFGRKAIARAAEQGFKPTED